MKLFKKKEQSGCVSTEGSAQASCCCEKTVEQESTCGCGDESESSCCCEKAVEQETCGCDVGLKVLGSGCKKCQTLEESARQAVLDLGLDIEVIHVSDFSEIAKYGVMSTPALVLNGQVLSYGKVLTVEEVKELLHGIDTKPTCCK